MALAGAIIRTRKERERRRQENFPEESQFSEASNGNQSSDKSPSSLKKLGSKSELIRKSPKLVSQSFDSEAGGTDGIYESGESYSTVYVGLVLFCMGSVITFVGLGDKGFKTLELKLIGPSLCLCGFLCVFYKILQCAFPRLFKWPKFCKYRAKLADTDPKTSSIPTGTENGVRNGHFANNGRPQKPNAQGSPRRVTLTSQQQVSSPKTPRPPSSVPNFIEDSSDEEDSDIRFVRPGLNGENPHIHTFEHHRLQQKLIQLQMEREQQSQRKEIVLNPNSLKL